MKAPLLALFSLLIPIKSALAQPVNDNCAQYTTLCIGNIVHGSNANASAEICVGCADGASSVGTFCYPVNNTVWFAFTTNSIGGAATLDVSNLACLIAAGVDTELELSVVAASAPCNSATYTVMGCTLPFSNNTTLNLAGLLPNTLYYVNVDGDQTGSGIISPAQCDFDITISGTAVDPIITQNITDATCANNDGQISITSVLPSTGPLQYSINGGAFQASSSFNNLAQGNYSIVIQDANGCVFSINSIVGLTGGPQDGIPNITAATACNTNTGQIQINGITGGTAPYTYSLNGGPPQASNAFSSLPPGTYNITAIDNTGCSFIYSNLVVSGTGGMTSVTFSVIQPTCNNPAGTITLTAVGGTPVVNYIMNGGAPTTNPIFSGLAPGNYNFLIFDGLGCTNFISLVVIATPTQTLQPSAIISPAILSICQGNTASFFASITNGGTAPNYNWMVNGISVQNGSSPFFNSTILNNGDNVTVTLTSNDPCVIQSSVVSSPTTVTVLPQINPTTTIVPNSLSVCEGDPIFLTANTAGCPSGTGIYFWDVNGVIVDSTLVNSFSFVAAIDAEVSVQFLCSDPCSNISSSVSQTIDVVQVAVDAGGDALIGEGGSTTLQGSGTGTYSWSPSNSLNNPTILTPVASPSSTTTYTLTVTSNGCSASDDVTVVVSPLIVVPNTITPNGDGSNDTWIIFRIESFPSCQITVYDRWGQKVFNSTGYRNENAWDGTYLGAKLPAAAYYYVIELNDEIQLDPYIGWIAIVY